ncbi:DUF3426 domain-containing protein [Lysobacter sp. HA35]
MFKPCPNCGFLVALIAGREASQRCPRCGSALVGENEVLDPDQDVPQRRRLDTERAPAEAPVRERAEAELRAPAEPAPTQEPVAAIEAVVDDVEAARNDVPADVAPTPDTMPRATHDGPSFVRRREARPAGRRWPLATVIGALALLFALQLLLAQRTALAADARWRPLVMNACGVLGCNVPAWHEPQAYRMVTRNVRPNPAKRGVLHVTATVRNDAQWPQPAPTIVLSLSDLDGRLVGARQVTPHDYGERVGALIAPGDSLDIAFDVREPGARVESYDFQLQ